MFFDTHVHLIDRSRLQYPWLAHVPPLDRDWSYDDYEKAARRVGITDALHMEVDVQEDQLDKETDFVAELMARPDSLIRGAISGARLESDGFEAWLGSVDKSRVKGVRRVLHTMPDELSQQNKFRENLRRLGKAGLPFDVCVLGRQLPLAVELADAAPDTTLILDHCGVPDIAGNAFDDWAKNISALAKRPNVNAKISGVSAYAAPEWTLKDLVPWVDHTIAAFGPERVVWGSDSPVCTLQSDIGEWVAVSQALLSAYTPDEQSAIRSNNARRIWQIA